MRKFDKEFWQKSLADPVFFASKFLEIKPHAGQVKWLQSSTKPENALHTGNRWGKSLVQAIKILHRCIFKIRNTKYDHISKYEAINASITLDQAKIIFENVIRLVKGKPDLERKIKEIKFTPFPHIVFWNGAIFWARSTQRRGEYLLGRDYDYFNFDEVAFEAHPEYVVNQVIMMRLADRAGILDYTSTPKGKNWFYQKCCELQKNPDFGYVQNGDSRENPNISQEYLKRKIKSLSPSKIEQNIKGLFIDDANQVIREEYIRDAMNASTGLSAPIAGHRYCHGWDLARKRTFTVGITLDVTTKPYQLIAFERFQREWKDVYATIRLRHKEYGGEIIIDSTGLGDVILAELSDIRPVGFNFGDRGGKAKSELIANLEKMHALGEVAYPYIEKIEEGGGLWTLQDELRNFYWDKNQECDAVMALALALWLVRESKNASVILMPRVEKI
ncbi:MAG: terminase family protein [Candidatus Zixiibacteriota bacterium]